MMVLGGKLRTRFNVSRIREVVVWSRAVRFHKDKMSSCTRCRSTCLMSVVRQYGHSAATVVRWHQPPRSTTASHPQQMEDRKRVSDEMWWSSV